MGQNSKLVIIADDHETSIMYFSLVMRRLGFSVIAASDGEQVLQILETVRPDLIITDRKMPKMDGVTLLKKIKADQNLSEIPVIVASAYRDQETIDEVMKLGSVGFLTKPIQLTDLYKMVQENVTYANNMKRNHLRFAYGKKVQVGFDGQEREFHAVTLSEGGIFLRTQKPLPVGTKVYTYLEVQDGQHLQVCGTVIYQKNVLRDISSIDPGMAIRFEGLTEVEATKLKDYIMEILAGDLLEEQSEPVISDQKRLESPLNAEDKGRDISRWPVLGVVSKSVH